METITTQTTVYAFDELSENAQDKAVSKVAEWISETWDGGYIIEDAARVAGILGIELSTHEVKLYGGGTRQGPDIHYTGFYSQGDGACFEGTYRYAKGSPKAIREYAPQDTVLHKIADTLRDVQARNFYRLEATVRHTGRYCHEHSMSICVEFDNLYRDVSDADTETVEDALRDFARWIYRQLRDDYEWQTDREQVIEAIEANGYRFLEDGTPY